MSQIRIILIIPRWFCNRSRIIKNTIDTAADISIIIPIYNGEQYLYRCLDSIPIKSSPVVEIICVDDGSTDNTLAILLRYKAIINSLIIIQSDHRGVSHARNLGIKNATGEYLCFVDVDDYLTSNSLSIIWNQLKDEKDDVLIHGAKCKPFWAEKWIRSNLCSKNKYFKNEKFNPLASPGCIPFIWTHVIRRELLIQNDLFFDETLELGEDQEFIFRYMQFVNSVRMRKARTYVHVVNKESAFHSILQKPELYLNQQLLMVKKITNNYINENVDQEEFFRWTFDILYWSCIKVNHEFTQDMACFLDTYHVLSYLDNERMYLYKGITNNHIKS